MLSGLREINWSLRKAPRIAWFLASQALLRGLDERLGREPREQALAAAVEAHARRGDPGSVLQVMDEFSRSQRWLMSMGPDKGALVTGALRDPAILDVLEIGTYCGYSALLIGTQLAARGGRLVTLEISRRNSAVARRVVGHAGLAGTIEVRNEVLRDAIASFRQPFDLVLLDHWKNEYLGDLQRLEAARLLRPGTIVIADNVGFFRVPDYLEYVRTSGRYESRYFVSTVEYNPQLPDGVEVSTFRG